MVNWKKLVKQIPARVQVKSNVYFDVVWCKEFPLDHEQIGGTNFEKKQITIKSGLSPKLTIITYLHELMHLFSDENSAALTETQILALEKSFYFLLKSGNIFK